MRNQPLIKIFCPSESLYLGSEIAKEFGLPLALHEERSFADGEHKLRPLESPLGCDVYVIQSLFSSPQLSIHDKIWRLLILVGAIRDAGADSVTVVIPYLCYARKDRRTKLMDPLSSRYLAATLESVGIRRIVTLEVHNIQAFENAFRCLTVHVEGADIFVEKICRDLGSKKLAVVSPDSGGMKRADRLRLKLEAALGKPVPLVVMEKYRSMDIMTGSLLVGDIQDRVGVIYDDILGSGGTVIRCGERCLASGATEVHVVATHGQFTGDAWPKLLDSRINSILVSDSVQPFSPRSKGVPIHWISAAPCLANAIKQLGHP